MSLKGFNFIISLKKQIHELNTSFYDFGMFLEQLYI